MHLWKKKTPYLGWKFRCILTKYKIIVPNDFKSIMIISMKTHIWNNMAINSVGILNLLVKFAALVLLFLYILRRFALIFCWNALWDSPLSHIHISLKKLFCEWRSVTTRQAHGLCTHGSLTNQQPIFSHSWIIFYFLNRTNTRPASLFLSLS